MLRGKYSVENVLGKPGAFGVAYKVIDTFGDIARVMKIYAGRENIDERMRQEYQTLLRIPPHPNVVKVIDGDYLEGMGGCVTEIGLSPDAVVDFTSRSIEPSS